MSDQRKIEPRAEWLRDAAALLGIVLMGVGMYLVLDLGWALLLEGFMLLFIVLAGGRGRRA